jgi:ubiquinone/menaquinone biosynthesis C-methylase UbiE
LDIGGGTGNFTRRLVEGAPHVQAVVVDPFLEFSSLQENTDQQVRFIKASAERFVSPRTKEEWWRTNYHQVLMKEVIHHLEAKDRVRIFRVMQQELQPTDKNAMLPSLLIITRPQYDHDYPLWSEARQVWAENQPSLETIQKELREAGFRHIEHSIEAYSCSTCLDRWLAMIKARFWSTFSNFTDQELEEACQRITRDETNRIDEKGDIHFEDRLLFITARN